MSKKAVLPFPMSMSGQAGVCENILFHSDKKAEESLHVFRDRVFQLKEEVNRLSFMMSEIRSVLETSSSTHRSVGVF